MLSETNVLEETNMLPETDMPKEACMLEDTNMSKEAYMLREINDILNIPEKKAHVDAIIPLLHGKWELQIMLEVVRADVLRFGEYKKRLPNITNSVLTAALRNLESWGLITRVQYNEIPPRVEYSPTEKGKSLLPVCYEIIKWGSENSLLPS